MDFKICKRQKVKGNRMKPLLLKIILPIIIIALGTVGMITLKKHAKKAAYKEPAQRIITVKTAVVHKGDAIVKIEVTGSVRPAQQVMLVPEVAGRITWISENLIPGSRFKKGDIIARIDKRDYKLMLEQQRGQVEQAQLNLALEKGRGDIARQEWNMLSTGQNGDNAPMLALRKPQMQEADQRARSAQSGLQRARLNLKKTTIKAPFDAIVVEKNVDIGQIVGPSSPLATLMGSQELWVDVSVPVEDLSNIQIPGLNSDTGSPVTVIQKAGNSEIRRFGKVIRLHGQLNNRNRTATVLVSIPNPFDLEGQLPLLAGAYVDVEIEGNIRKDVIKIPRNALRNQSSLWLVKDGRLKKVSVKIAWKQRSSVVLEAGLDDGEEIVVGPLSFPMDGMLVKKLSDNNKGAKNE